MRRRRVRARRRRPARPTRGSSTSRRWSRHSRNASFTYIGRDDSTPLVDLVFECRLDTTNDQAWEDCEYPHEVRNLSPGVHTLEIRAVDIGELADDTPARYTWEYRPLPADDPPEVFIDMAPRAETWALDAMFTFHSNEPDVTFECRVDFSAWENCGFETVGAHEPGRLRVGSRGDRGRPAHVLRARHRLRGQRRPAGDVHLAPARRRDDLHRRSGLHARHRGRARQRRRGPELGGDDRVRVQRRRRDVRVLARPRAVRRRARRRSTTPACCRATTSCAWWRPTRRPARPSSRPRSTSGRCSSRSTTRRPRPRSSARRPTAAARRCSSSAAPTTRRRRRCSTFECRVDSTSELDWEECDEPVQPARALHVRRLPAGARPARLRGARGRHVRAADPGPEQPGFEGNVDPTPVGYEWTSTRGHERARAPASPSGPSGRTAETEATFEFFGTDNATPGAPDGVRVLGRRRAVRAVQLARDRSLEPGTHTLPDARRRHGRQRRPDARGAHVGDRGGAGRDDHVRPDRPHPARAAGPAGAEHRGARVSRSPPTSRTRRSSARSTAPSSSPARPRTWRSRSPTASTSSRSAA